MKNSILLFGLILITLTSCVIIRPGEVAVKQRLGKLVGEPKSQGITLVNPFITEIIKIPIRTVNREIKLNLPSKEGLNVAAEISILYHVKEDKAMDIKVGSDFERVLILSTFSPL